MAYASGNAHFRLPLVPKIPLFNTVAMETLWLNGATAQVQSLSPTSAPGGQKESGGKEYNCAKLSNPHFVRLVSWGIIPTYFSDLAELSSVQLHGHSSFLHAWHNFSRWYFLRRCF